MKLEMAKFLQDTIEEIAVVKSKGKNKEKLQKFSEFVRTVSWCSYLLLILFENFSVTT